MRLFQPDGTARFDLFEAVRGLRGGYGEWRVRVDDHQPEAPLLQMRLIAAHKPPEACKTSRRRIRKRAQDKGQTVDPRTLEAADYVLVLTSWPEATFPTVAVLDLYRLRWQVELAFKRWKSVLDLGTLPARTSAVAKAWILGKLIGVLLIDEQLAGLRELFPPERRCNRPSAVPVE